MPQNPALGPIVSNLPKLPPSPPVFAEIKPDPPKSGPSMDTITQRTYTQFKEDVQRHKIDWKGDRQKGAIEGCIKSTVDHQIGMLTDKECRELIRGMVETDLRQQLGWP